ncbi:glycosyl hydrolase 53 family protein [Kineococcus sp. SYSU DK005]|uniref:glycosyl hydrolase 53 family protein n=1 Tax=Kineococcus sp. SYSU DK005 TaxID=3383126 RepID=UPI003D7CC29D
MLTAAPVALALLAALPAPAAVAGEHREAPPAVADASFENSSRAWRTDGEKGTAALAGPGRTGAAALLHSSRTERATSTYQVIRNVPDGYYDLTGWTTSTGGQQQAVLFAASASGAEARTALPVSTQWTRVVVRGVHVQGGELTLGLRTSGSSGQVAKLDDVSLTAGRPYQFLKGADITQTNYVESKGGTYRDAGGQQKDPLLILAEQGVNLVRLRLYNGTGPEHPRIGHPGDYLPEGFQDEQDVLDLARRAHRYGMQIQLTFHYSDYWSNGAIQDIPKDWRDVTSLPQQQAVDKLEAYVSQYTSAFLRKMQQQGTPPSFVSLGNEMQSGILFPYGQAWGGTEGNLARFLTAGYDAVKSVVPEAQVVLHLHEATNEELYRWFFGLMDDHHVPYDVIGSSYYPFWTQEDVPAAATFFAEMSAELGKPFLVMETGVNWNPLTHDGVEGQLTDQGPVPYAETPQGQRDFMLELFAALKAVPDGAVLGDIYWDPMMIPAPGVGWQEGGDNVVSNTTLFDFDGRALPVFQAYRDNTEGYGGADVTGRITTRTGSPVAGATVSISTAGRTWTVRTDDLGYYWLDEVVPGRHKVLVRSAGIREQRVGSVHAVPGAVVQLDATIGRRQ